MCVCVDGGGDRLQVWTFVVVCVNGLLVEMYNVCVCEHLHVRMNGRRCSAEGAQGNTRRGKQSAPAIVP